MPCLCRLCSGVYSFLCSGHCSGPDIENKRGLFLTFILGYLVYFAVFELVIVPMTLKWVSLTAAAYIWAGIMALVICAAVICTIKKQRRIRAGQTETCSGIFGSISEIWKNHSVMIILAGAVVLLQCLIVIFYEDTTVDAAYYVGTVSTSVYTDTLGRYNPFNGAIQKHFRPDMFFPHIRCIMQCGADFWESIHCAGKAGNVMYECSDCQSDHLSDR